MILKLKSVQFLFSLTLLFFISCNYLFAETRTVIYERDAWKVHVNKYEDGTRACVASVSNDEIELQIYKSSDFYELATYYDDYTNKKLDFLKFKIDNNEPWIDNEPEYNNGWLISNISTYSKEAANKIEREMRAGKKFYQMDENDVIAWFSLIGSNKAFDVFDECVSKGGYY